MNLLAPSNREAGSIRGYLFLEVAIPYFRDASTVAGAIKMKGKEKNRWVNKVRLYLEKCNVHCLVSRLRHGYPVTTCCLGSSPDRLGGPRFCILSRLKSAAPPGSSIINIHDYDRFDKPAHRLGRGFCSSVYKLRPTVGYLGRIPPQKRKRLIRFKWRAPATVTPADKQFVSPNPPFRLNKGESANRR